MSGFLCAGSLLRRRQGNSSSPAASAGIVMAACLVAVASLPAPALAQEMRIYTRVVKDSLADERPQVLARTLSLFHAGKVFDYIATADEVTVFDPANRRIVILDTSRQLATTIDFDELKNLLRLGKQEATEYAEQLERRGGDAARSAALIRFQLAPQFETRFDSKGHRLVLEHPGYRYEVRCVPSDRPEVLRRYLDYADWMARLNWVLHPQALLPAPRLALNAELRRRHLQPVEVSLWIGSTPELRLRATHEIRWSLDKRDRALIEDWEQLLRSRRVREVPFRQYQEARFSTHLRAAGKPHEQR